MGEISEFPSSRPLFAAPAALSHAHDCTRFSCGHEALDDWLREQALKSEGKTARTFVTTVGSQVVGYYCLAAGSERRSSMPKKIRHGLPDPVPLTIIGRLAVDRSFQGQKLGAALLKDGLERALGAAQTVGTRAILVHAIDAAAVSFYARFGFIEFPSDSRTLFLPVETIASAL